MRLRSKECNMNLSSLLLILHVAVARADLATTEVPRDVGGLVSGDSGITRAGLTRLSDAVLEEHRYNRIIIGEYESAVANTVQLHESLKGNVISQVVSRLLRDRKTNALGYAHRLHQIAEYYFPIQFKVIFDQNDENDVEVNNTVTGIRLGLMVAIGANSTSLGKTWELKPVWDTDQLSFKMLNVETGHFFYLDERDHLVYAGVDDQSTKFLWYLQPARFEYDLVFFVRNRALEQVLELQDVDADGLMDAHEMSEYVHGWLVMPI